MGEFGAILLVLLLLLAAIYLSEIAKKRTRNLLNRYRTFGWNSICCLWFFDWWLSYLNSKSFGLPVGETALAGSVVLAIMVLPTLSLSQRTQCATHRVP
jgi:phosphate transport system permease protein